MLMNRVEEANVFDVELSCGDVSGSDMNHTAEMSALLPATCPGLLTGTVKGYLDY